MQPIPCDSDVLQQVIQDHLHLVYSAALRQTHDAHLAEDVTQAVFILFMRKRHSISAQHTAGWLINAAYFTSRQAIRSARRRNYHEQQAAMNKQNLSNVPSHELAEVLDQAMAGLPTRSRTAVVLRYLEGQSVSDVAATLLVSENAATKIILRGLTKLRRILGRNGPTLSLTPAAITVALADIAAKSSSMDLSHIANGILAHWAAPAANMSALAHAAAKWMFWAKIQTTAVVLGTVLAISGVGVVVARQASLPAHSPSTLPAQPRLQFRLVEKLGVATTQPFTSIFDPDQSRKLRVDNQLLMDESAVASAKTILDQQGSGYAISVQLTPQASKLFSEITANNIGRPLAIIFDGRLLSAPIILSQINGSVYITGNFSKSEADAIVAALNSNHPSTPATQTSSNVVIQDFGYRLGPSIELHIPPSMNNNPASTYISLQHQRIILPPAGLTWNPQAPIPFNPTMDKWLQDNDIDLLIVAGDQKVHMFGIRANYIPAAMSPETTAADIVESIMKKTSRWNVNFPEPVALPFDFYVQDYSQHFAIAELSENIQSHGSYLFHYRLIEPDPTRLEDEHLALADSEFLYARTYSTPTRAGLRITVAGDRLKQLGKTDHYYTGGLFLNGQLLTIGWFDLADRSFTSDIFSTIDTTPQRAEAIAQQLNQATSDNGYKRFIRLYSLSPGQVLRYIPPPFPPERKYAMWPVPISTNGLLIFNSKNGEPIAHQYTSKIQTLPLADIINDVAGLQNYDFVVDPSLLQIKLSGDFVVNPSAKPEAKLSALQKIISAETGQKIRITKSIMKRPVIVALGHYDFTPLPESNHPDAVAITTTTTNMISQEQDSGSDSWQGMLDMMGDYIGMRIINMVENPPKTVKWANYASVWTTYNAAAQSSDPKQLNALLQILSAQTDLDFKIETHPEGVYMITPAP